MGIYRTYTNRLVECASSDAREQVFASNDNGIGIIERNGLYNYEDAQGNLLSDVWFLYCEPFIDDMRYTSVKIGEGVWKFIDLDGCLSDKSFSYIGRFVEGYCVVKSREDGVDIYDKDLRDILIDKHTYIYIYDYNPLSDTFIACNRKGKCLLNNDGMRISEFYDDIREFYGETTCVKKQGMWNIINQNGDILMKTWFNNQTPIEPKCIAENMYNVIIGGKYYYLDVDGNVFMDNKIIANILIDKYKK